MIAYALRRLAVGVPLLAAVSVIAYALLYRAADPLTRLRQVPGVRGEDLRRLIAQQGLDETWYRGYLSWLGGFLRGEWGVSARRGTDALERIAAALPATLELLAAAVVLSALAAVVLGVWTAARPGSRLDLTVSGAAHLGVAVPTFLLGLFLQSAALWLQDHGWSLPLLLAGVALALAGLLRARSGGVPTVALAVAGAATTAVALALWGRLGRGELVLYTSERFSFASEGDLLSLNHLQHLVLPALTLSAVTAATWTRYQRAVSAEVLASPHVRAARARGLSERRAIARHALRGSLAPLVTVVCVDAGALISGAVVTETVFSWPGMGRLLYESALDRDINVAMGIVMIGAAAVLVMNLVADLAYAALDPRVELGARPR